MKSWIIQGVCIVAACFVALAAVVVLGAARYIETSTRDLLIATLIIVAMFVLLPLILALIIRRTIQGVAQDVKETFAGFNPAQLESFAVKHRTRVMLEQSLRTSFLKSDQVTAYKWETSAPRLVLIYEDLSMEETVQILRVHGYKGNAPQGITSRCEAFKAINDVLPSKQKFEYLGSIEEPQPCDVYVSPDHES